MTVLSTINSILSLGLTPLPVASAQPEILNRDGKLIFTGKNPSYIDANGCSQVVHHKHYVDNPPSQSDLDMWFQSPNVGIGALGSASIVFIDIDVKHFKSQQHCNDVVAEWLNTHPQLQSCWRESTRSGGYRVVIRLSSPPTFTNFKFAHYDRHCGEVLGLGRFAVMYPTPGYHRLNDPNVVDVASLESVGILPAKQSTALSKQAVESQAVDAWKDGDPIQIMERVNDVVKTLLNDNKKPNDRSKALTTVIRELYGWKNYLAEQGQNVSEDIDGIIQRYAYSIDVSREKVERIYASIKLNECQPSKPNPQPSYIPQHMTAEKNIIASLLSMPNPPRYNTHTQAVEYGGYSTTGEAIAELKEVMYVSVGTDNLHKVTMSRKDFLDIVVSWVSTHNPYSPIAEYLNGLIPTESDVIDQLVDRMGLTTDEKVWLTKWLLQSVERALHPGCDAPYMLVLYGSQGCGKTFTLKAIAKDWFVVLNPKNSAGKDGLMLYHRGWIVCNDELSTLSRYGIESLKSEITTPDDTLRLPFRAAVQTMKRGSVLCGTTNESEFLKDGTGNRRFLVLHFRNNFTAGDREWLSANVDRLWGQIMWLRQSGIDYHLTNSEAESLKETHKAHSVLSQTDTVVLSAVQWLIAVPQRCNNRPTFNHIITLARHCRIDLTPQRVSKTLKGLGFETKRIGRVNNRTTVITNPELVNEFNDIPTYGEFNGVVLTPIDDSEADHPMVSQLEAIYSQPPVERIPHQNQTQMGKGNISF